ncbi:MAG TPA: hypothetical protein VMO00_00025 [Methylomirabilota bacterium]|nr:hypothetical protein [Methylomirabilota bacterium]
MKTASDITVQILVFSLVAAAFTTACGYAYTSHGWSGAVTLSTAVLLLPLSVGVIEIVQAGAPPSVHIFRRKPPGKLKR